MADKDTGAEFYPTPRWCIGSLLEGLTLPGGRWIEPCAGTGRIVSTVNEHRRDVRWTLCEIDDRFDNYLRPMLRPGDELLAGDFVHREWTRRTADVLIMNPPFSLALPFVVAAFERAAWVVMLQRTNWFGSKGRAPWLARQCPDVYALPERPSFTPDGGTDSCEYSWFVWPPGDRNRRAGRLSMLEMPKRHQPSLFGGA